MNTIKKVIGSREGLSAFAAIVLCFAYALRYFNYFEIPSEDFLGNLLPLVQNYRNGIFLDNYNKILPGFPMVLTAASYIVPDITGDPVYSAAIIINIILYLPYLFVVFYIYRRFLNHEQALVALIILGFNLNSVYMAVNSELEIFLTLTTAIALALSLSRPGASLIMALIASTIKFDVIGIIPAVTYRKIAALVKKKWFRITALGLLILAIVSLAIVLSRVNILSYPYVNETIRRGPSLHRFLIDMLLVSSCFFSWMGPDAYLSQSWYVTITLYASMAVVALSIIISSFCGVKALIHDKKKDIGPILVFAGFFVLVHILYQNSKSRYVLPILWILNLFIFYGFFNVIIPWIKNIASRRRSFIPVALISFILVVSINLSILVVSWIANGSPLYTVIFGILFTVISSIIMIDSCQVKKPYTIMLVSILLFSIAMSSAYYGKRAMDHYSLRRIEFKNVALWYEKNKKPGDVMLITEKVIAQYYTGLSDSFFYVSDMIYANTIPELIIEMKKRHINMVFIDDFYISRLLVKDKNSSRKKAELMLDLRRNYHRYHSFRLIRVFEYGETKSYLLHFAP